MAQIVTIGKLIARKGIQDEHDVVKIFKDKHVFSKIEVKQFNIYQVAETTTSIKLMFEDVEMSEKYKFPTQFTGTSFKVKDGDNYSLGNI